MPTLEDNTFCLAYNLDGLLPSSKTQLVAILASSNIPGSIIPAEDVVRALRKRARELMIQKMRVSVD